MSFKQFLIEEEFIVEGIFGPANIMRKAMLSFDKYVDQLEKIKTELTFLQKNINPKDRSAVSGAKLQSEEVLKKMIPVITNFFRQFGIQKDIKGNFFVSDNVKGSHRDEALRGTSSLSDVDAMGMPVTHDIAAIKADLVKQVTSLVSMITIAYVSPSGGSDPMTGTYNDVQKRAENVISQFKAIGSKLQDRIDRLNQMSGKNMLKKSLGQKTLEVGAKVGNAVGKGVKAVGKGVLKTGGKMLNRAMNSGGTAGAAMNVLGTVTGMKQKPKQPFYGKPYGNPYGGKPKNPKRR